MTTIEPPPYRSFDGRLHARRRLMVPETDLSEFKRLIVGSCWPGYTVAETDGRVRTVRPITHLVCRVLLPRGNPQPGVVEVEAVYWSDPQ